MNACVASKWLSHCLERSDSPAHTCCFSHKHIYMVLFASLSSDNVDSMCMCVGGGATHTSVNDGRQLGDVWIDILRNPLPQICVHFLCLWTPGGGGGGGKGGGGKEKGKGEEEGRERGRGRGGGAQTHR